MKSLRSIVCSVLSLLLAILFSACLEVETTSTVHPDGSIDRTITFDDDSASVYRDHYTMMPLDASWQKSIQKMEEKKFRLTATRHFQNAEDMSGALRGTYGKTFQFQFGLERQFRWFFTNYRFTEANLKYVQVEIVPMSDYLSQYEIEGWRIHEVEKKPYGTRGDSLAMMSAGSRFEQWEQRNAFEAIFPVFVEGAKRLNSPLLKAPDLIKLKDTLYSCSGQYAKKNIDTLPYIFAKFLKNPLVHKAWRANIQAITEVKEKLAIDFGGSYVTNVVMPGLITGSNAQTIEGNKATWRDFKDYAKFFGYTMWVESREVNWWAVILTAAIVLVLAILLVAASFRKRRLV